MYKQPSGLFWTFNQIKMMFNRLIFVFLHITLLFGLPLIFNRQKVYRFDLLRARKWEKMTERIKILVIIQLDVIYQIRVDNLDSDVGDDVHFPRSTWKNSNNQFQTNGNEIVLLIFLLLIYIFIVTYWIYVIEL